MVSYYLWYLPWASFCKNLLFFRWTHLIYVGYRNTNLSFHSDGEYRPSVSFVTKMTSEINYPVFLHKIGILSCNTSSPNWLPCVKLWPTPCNLGYLQFYGGKSRPRPVYGYFFIYFCFIILDMMTSSSMPESEKSEELSHDRERVCLV